MTILKCQSMPRLMPVGYHAWRPRDVISKGMNYSSCLNAKHFALCIEFEYLTSKRASVEIYSEPKFIWGWSLDAFRSWD